MAVQYNSARIYTHVRDRRDVCGAKDDDRSTCIDVRQHPPLTIRNGDDRVWQLCSNERIEQPVNVRWAQDSTLDHPVHVSRTVRSFSTTFIMANTQWQSALNNAGDGGQGWEGLPYPNTSSTLGKPWVSLSLRGPLARIADI